MSSNGERGHRAGDVGGQPVGDRAAVDALDGGLAGGGVRRRSAVVRPCPDATRAAGPAPRRAVGRAAAARYRRGPWSTSPMPRSRRRCSSAPSRSRWWSTCWAPWCGPCTTLGPMLEQAVAATEGDVELAKVNVDENPAVSASFRVQSIPAVFAVRDGAVVDQFIGALPEAEVRAFVDRLAPAQSEADLLAVGRGRRRRRGAPAAGPAARARPPGRRPGPGRAADRPGGHRGGHRAARPGPRDARDPPAAGRGPAGRAGRRGRSRRRAPCSTVCSTG